METALPQITIHELIKKCCQKNREAFSMLYDKYCHALMGVIVRITNDAELSEDLLQETFIGIWKSIETFDSKRLVFVHGQCA